MAKSKRKYISTNTDYTALRVGDEVSCIPNVVNVDSPGGSFVGWTVPEGIMSLKIQARGNVVLRISSENDGNPYVIVKANTTFEVDDLYTRGAGGDIDYRNKLYFYTTGADVVEIFYWTSGI
jgi:hypothetical protein